MPRYYIALPGDLSRRGLTRLYPSKPFSPESGKAINARIARASVLLDLEASIKSFNINLNHYRNLCFLDGDEFGIGKKKIFLFYLL